MAYVVTGTKRHDSNAAKTRIYTDQEKKKIYKNAFYLQHAPILEPKTDRNQKK